MTRYKSLSDINPDAIVPDGFDLAYLGYAERDGSFVAVFDATECLLILRDQRGMTEDGAMEYFFCNVEGASFGKNAPMYVWK